MSDINRLDRPDEPVNELAYVCAGVGHTVINAFSAIVSNAELLKLSIRRLEALDRASDLADAGETATIIETIVRTSFDAASIARRMIDYTRGLTTIGRDQVSIERVIRLALDQPIPKAGPNIRWETRIESSPSFLGDEAQIIFALNCLIDNAIESFHDGSGTIGIVSEVDDRGWVQIVVSDDGEGMDAAIVRRAIEPFFTTKPGRFGLGLTLANGVWRRHGGTMSITTAPGEGTSVRLRLDPANPPRIGAKPGSKARGDAPTF